MAKIKKVLSLVLSLALSASSLTGMAHVSAATRNISDILNESNAELAVWVKASDGIQDGAWKNNAGGVGDLIAKGKDTTPEVTENAINGYPAVKLVDAMGGTFFSVKYDTPYTGDSTVFMVTKLNALENYKGLYSTGNGEDIHQAGTYENMIMSYGKVETKSYDAAGAEQKNDRACEGSDYTIKTDEFMNYSYNVRVKGEKVNAAYKYSFETQDEKSGSFDRADVSDGYFLNHTGFVIGARDKFEEWSAPDMEVAETIVILGTLSDDDISTVRNYLQTKYFGSGYDPFAPVDYSKYKIPDQLDPLLNQMPLAEDSRVALWVDGDSFDAENKKWIDKSASHNDMTVYGDDVAVNTSAEVNNKKVVHFPGTSKNAAAVKLPEIYEGSSTIYFVYKPYKVDAAGAPEGYSYSYKGIYTTDYLPCDGNGQIGRCGGIDIRHGGDGVEIGFQSASSGQALGFTPDYSINARESSFVYNAGRTDVAASNGSSYYGYTKGFLDFEVEAVVSDTKTTLNFDFKDAEGSIPSTNTGADAEKRGINRSSSNEWDTTNGTAKADKHYGYTIGNRWDQNGSGLLMDVAEMIVVHGTLSEKEKSDVSEYIRKKYFVDPSAITPPEKMLTSNVVLNYTNDQGEAATGGVSEAYNMTVTGTVSNKYLPNRDSASVIVALYDHGKLYSLDMRNVYGISETGANFEVPYLNLPSDKSDLKVKIFALYDAENGDITPAIDALSANISVL